MTPVSPLSVLHDVSIPFSSSGELNENTVPVRGDSRALMRTTPAESGSALKVTITVTF